MLDSDEEAIRRAGEEIGAAGEGGEDEMEELEGDDDLGDKEAESNQGFQEGSAEERPDDDEMQRDDDAAADEEKAVSEANEENQE